MPFRDAEKRGELSALDVDILRTAYGCCCERLGYDPASSDTRHDLAEHLMRAFRAGERNPETLASIACRTLS